jgi:hypothetical protein
VVGGGQRIFLSDHMKDLWLAVEFVPVSFELDDDDQLWMMFNKQQKMHLSLITPNYSHQFIERKPV